ncbi:MAG: GAF domain-containing protein [Brevinematia bacterium]
MKEKNEIFNSLFEKVIEIVSSESSTNDKLISICELLTKNIPYYNWVGFYLVDKSKNRQLILGPFVGEPTEHVIIPFGKGICGQAVEKKSNNYSARCIKRDKLPIV